MSKISRRNFLKGAGASALGLMATGLMGCSAVETTTEAGTTAGSTVVESTTASALTGTYIPGTYTASAQGISKVTVTMTFDTEKITNVELDVAGETAGYGKDAKDALIQQIMNTQSSAIDGVSGATITSGAVRKAAENCIAQAKGLASAPTTGEQAQTMVPEGISVAEVEGSWVELGDITPDEVKNFDVVVVGAGAAGVPAAGIAAENGASVALLQKQNIVVSQGMGGSAIIKSRSTEQGLKKWLHLTNALCAWRSNTELLKAYMDHSEEALMWVLNRAGLTEETEYGDGKLDVPNISEVLRNDEKGLFAFANASVTLTGNCGSRIEKYDLGDDYVRVFAAALGPKPKNTGDVLAAALENVQNKCPNLETYFSTPAVKLVTTDGKVTGVIGKTEEGKYIQFNAAKGVILATGDYQNNSAMVKRWCPDVAEFDKKQYQKTGDGHLMAIAVGAKMEDQGHTKMMHDFDSGMMYEEPFLNLDMNGKRFCNEDIEFAYIGNVLKYTPAYNGNNVDSDHPNGSLGWYCQIFDNNYMSYANSPIPEAMMSKYIPTEGEVPVGVFANLIDTYKADTLEELAGYLGLPVAEFKASVERYNALCDKGFDEDFGKPAKYMNKIEAAPYWGIRKHIRVSAICAGVDTNANSQPLDKDGKVIEGLYCVGNLAGNFYGGADYPLHHPGMSLGRSYTNGLIAAKHALGLL